MGRVMAVVNQKGGIGKTTSTFAIGTALADRGLAVLLIDFDPQASLTTASGFEPDRLDRTIYTLITDYLRALTPPALTPALQEIAPTLHLLPANIDLAAAEFDLVMAVRREYVLQQVLVGAAAYDVVLIDCPPSLGMLTINALTAAHSVLIPVVPEYLAVRGLEALLRSIDRTQRAGLNPALTVDGVLFTMVASRVTHGRQVMEAVRTHLGSTVPMLGEIRRSIRVAEAAEHGVPLTRYSGAGEIASAYAVVAEALLHTWGLSQAVTPSPVTMGVPHE